MILKLLYLGVWMVLVPLGVGYFVTGIPKTKKLKGGAEGMETLEIGYMFCLGYILMWAVFQLIAVPFVLRGAEFLQVERIFTLICLLIAAAGAVLFLLHLKCGVWKKLMICRAGLLQKIKSREGLTALFLWGVFFAALLFQVLQAYRLAYADGDDAFYIPISVEAGSSGLMYVKDPYTGYALTVNARYGLAPFPIWVAFIASKCGVNAAVAAHSLIPLILIPVTYVIYFEIGKLLCRDIISGKDRKTSINPAGLLPLFMIFVLLLQIFGNYSIYPASTFLLTRTRQGKAALGNVILPFFILLLYRMAEEVKTRGKASVQSVFALMAAMTAGCLCSTISGFLGSMLVMLTAGLLFILYKKPHILWQAFLGCVPGIIYALLYLRY